MSGYSSETLTRMLEVGIKERYGLDARFRNLCRSILELSEACGKRKSPSCGFGIKCSASTSREHRRAIDFPVYRNQLVESTGKCAEAGQKTGYCLPREGPHLRDEEHTIQTTMIGATQTPLAGSNIPTSTTTSVRRSQKSGGELGASRVSDAVGPSQPSFTPSKNIREKTAAVVSTDRPKISGHAESRSMPLWWVRRLVLDESAAESICLVRGNSQQQWSCKVEDDHQATPSRALHALAHGKRWEGCNENGCTENDCDEDKWSGQDEKAVLNHQPTIIDSNPQEQSLGWDDDSACKNDRRRYSGAPIQEEKKHNDSSAGRPAAKTRRPGRAPHSETSSSVGEKYPCPQEESQEASGWIQAGVARNHGGELGLRSEAGFAMENTIIRHLNDDDAKSNSCPHARETRELYDRAIEQSPQHQRRRFVVEEEQHCRGKEGCREMPEGRDCREEQEGQNRWLQRGRVLRSLHAEPAARVSVGSRPALLRGESTTTRIAGIKPYHGLYARLLNANGINPVNFRGSTAHCHGYCDCQHASGANTSLNSSGASSKAPRDDMDNSLLLRGYPVGDPLAKERVRAPVDGLPDRLEAGRILDSLNRRAELIGKPRPTPLRAKAAWMENPGDPGYSLVESSEGLLSSFCRQSSTSGSTVSSRGDWLDRRRAVYVVANTLPAAAEAWNKTCSSKRGLGTCRACGGKRNGGGSKMGGWSTKGEGEGVRLEGGGIGWGAEGALGCTYRGGDGAAAADEGSESGGSSRRCRHVAFSDHAPSDNTALSPTTNKVDSPCGVGTPRKSWREATARHWAVSGAARFPGRYFVENKNSQNSTARNSQNSSRADKPRSRNSEPIERRQDSKLNRSGARCSIDRSTAGRARGSDRRRDGGGSRPHDAGASRGGSCFQNAFSASKTEPAWVSTAELFYA